MIDEILKKFSLKYEDLNQAEKDTLNVWISSLQNKQLTPEKIKDYIVTMRYSVEQELVKTDINSKQDLFLKARLKNYMLLEALLTSPGRAKEQLEQALSSIKK